VYCWNCSAPQVRISTELLEQAQTQLDAAAQPGNPATEAVPAGIVPPALNRWTGAIQCAGLAGGIAAVLTLVSFAAQPATILIVFWCISAPIVVLGVYAGRFRNTRITAGFAARLGILCGVAILLSMFSLDTIHLCLERFVFHTATEVDTQLAAAFAQQATVMRAQLGADAAPALTMLGIPEFRAGLLLSSFALVSALYLVYSAVAGAFAGLLRSRATVRPSTR